MGPRDHTALSRVTTNAFHSVGPTGASMPTAISVRAVKECHPAPLG